MKTRLKIVNAGIKSKKTVVNILQDKNATLNRYLFLYRNTAFLEPIASILSKRFIKSLLVVLGTFLSLTAFAGQTIPLSQDDILYIYDADTFFVRCPECNKNKRGVRVMGVDSPEIKGKCQAEKLLARKAKQFAVGKIRTASIINLIPNPKRRYDRYDRLLAWVQLDGFDLGEMLIEAGLGREYHGGKRQGWCDER